MTAIVACAPDSNSDNDLDTDIELSDEIIFESNEPAPIDDQGNLVDYVAQCEAVLGPIPEINCDPENPAPGTTVTRIPVFVDGQLLGFGDHERDAELLARREESGDYTCDFPSVGGDFACTVGSTLVHYENPENPNVQWVGLCRGVGYDNPTYDRFIGNGLIGANEVTGEMCFFFGGNPDHDEPYVLPRLTSEADDQQDLAPWKPPLEMPGSCLSCHPNNDPWVLTPWLQPSYMRPVLEGADYPLSLPEGVELDDVMAARFIRQTSPQYKTRLPDPVPEDRLAWTEEEIFDESGRLAHRQYRAVGSSYVANESAGTVMARTGIRPESWQIGFRERLQLVPASASCANGCHAVANEYFDHLAQDSLGLGDASRYRSALMTERGPADGMWMPPFIPPSASMIETFQAGEPSIPAITECPIPKRLTGEPEIDIECSGRGPVGARVRLRWDYENDFGQVPGRDDVRFDVAFGPSDDMGLGLGLAARNDVEGDLMEGADFEVLQDVAAFDASTTYEIEIPVDEDTEDLAVLIQPKRFCFEEPDRRPFAYASPMRLEIDIVDACE